MAAQIQPLDIVAPGSLGTNEAAEDTLLPNQFALPTTKNARLDENGRLSARQGWAPQTSAVAITGTPAVEQIHVYRKSDGTLEDIVSWDSGVGTGIGNSLLDPEGNDVLGATVNGTNGNWQFLNFNDKCIAVQSGQTALVYTGTTFEPIVAASGAVPTGGVGLAAYGRLWIVDGTDQSQLHYSALLDETRWDSTDAGGTVDLSKVWTDGMDVITAVAGFNGDLVVFGKRHIVFITDGQGSELGLDPAQLYVRDIIQGAGCQARDSVQLVGEADIMFLGQTGVQSLGRIIQEKSNPKQAVTAEIYPKMRELVNQSDADQVRSVYHEQEGWYWVSFPDEALSIWVDVRRGRTGVEGFTAPSFFWDLVPTALSYKQGSVYTGQAGLVGTYEGSGSDNGTAYQFIYESPWLPIDPELSTRLKLLKHVRVYMFTSEGGTITLRWGFDFNKTYLSAGKTYDASASDDVEWNSSEWAIATYGAPLTFQNFKFNTRGSGNFIQVQVRATVTDALALQRIILAPKFGRIT